MIAIDSGWTEEEAKNHIEQECSALGQVRQIDMFLKPSGGAKPFVLVYMVKPGEVDALIQKFGGYATGRYALIQLSLPDASN